MKTKLLLIVLVLLAVVLLSGCSSAEPPTPLVPAGAQAGDLTDLESCEYLPAGSKTTYTAECGTLVVPENWEKSGSRLITLPVVRVPASGSNPAEPVFFLNGGPGQTNLYWAPPEWLLENHEVIFVGYRGIDGMVRLSCPELGSKFKNHLGKDIYSESARAEYESSVRQCVTTHEKAGVDLLGYNVPGVIKDMEAVRTALGYERVNLFSESYGTRVAQIYAYMAPQSLNRLVLIGVNTPGHFIDDPAVFDDMIVYLSELCNKDTSCSSRTDDFARTMFDVNHNMPKRWLFFPIDSDTIRLGTYYMFMANPDMTSVLDAYLAAGDGDASALGMANLMVKMMPVDSFVFGDSFSKAAPLDLDRYGGIESVELGDSIMGAPSSEMLWPMAELWPIDLLPQNLRELQESDVEMLLVNGTVDFSTPPTALDEARPFYHRAQTVLLPEFSHVADVQYLQPEAFQRLVTSYYDTGVGDDSLFVYQPLSFKPRVSLALMARLVVAGLVLVAALILLVVVLVVRRIRRRQTNGS